MLGVTTCVHQSRGLLPRTLARPLAGSGSASSGPSASAAACATHRAANGLLGAGGAASRSLHTASRPNRVFYDKMISSYHRPGMPSTFKVTTDRPWYPRRILEWEVMPRDEFGVPAHIPPDVSTTIEHTYAVPPEYFPFLKKLGEETPSLKPWMEKLIKGKMTFADYEEMFYSHAKPLRIHRSKLALPYRTEEEIAKSKVVDWEGKWLSFRQRVRGEYYTRFIFRDWFLGIIVALWIVQLLGTQMAFYCEDMKLFYLEAPEHKINWVVPRGDL